MQFLTVYYFVCINMIFRPRLCGAFFWTFIMARSNPIIVNENWQQLSSTACTIEAIKKGNGGILFFNDNASDANARKVLLAVGEPFPQLDTTAETWVRAARAGEHWELVVDEAV